jgi:hypothetical protein
VCRRSLGCRRLCSLLCTISCCGKNSGAKAESVNFACCDWVVTPSLPPTLLCPFSLTWSLGTLARCGLRASCFPPAPAAGSATLARFSQRCRAHASPALLALHQTGHRPIWRPSVVSVGPAVGACAMAAEMVMGAHMHREPVYQGTSPLSPLCATTIMPARASLI